MIPSAILNNVLVKIDWEVKRQMQYKSLSLEIIPFEGKLNDSYDPKGHRQTKGVVVSLPLGFSDEPAFTKIRKDVRLGDTIYFHFNSIDEDTRIEIGEDYYYQISYDQIICIVRDGEIIMVGGRILVRPYFDKDIQDIDHLGGKIKVKTTASGLVSTVIGWDVESKDGHHLNKGTLAHISHEAVGDMPLPIKAGDTVYFETDSDWENWIEDKMYFVMRQEDLILKEI